MAGTPQSSNLEQMTAQLTLNVQRTTDNLMAQNEQHRELKNRLEKMDAKMQERMTKYEEQMTVMQAGMDRLHTS